MESDLSIKVIGAVAFADLFFFLTVLGYWRISKEQNEENAPLWSLIFGASPLAVVVLYFITRSNETPLGQLAGLSLSVLSAHLMFALLLYVLVTNLSGRKYEDEQRLPLWSAIVPILLIGSGVYSFFAQPHIEKTHASVLPAETPLAPSLEPEQVRRNEMFNRLIHAPAVNGSDIEAELRTFEEMFPNEQPLSPEQ